MAHVFVSDFMTNTCRVRPQPNINRLQALSHTIIVANDPVDEYAERRIVTSSGSSSEFFIEPMLSCINDLDIMWHRSDQLAIPAGHSAVPQYLPAEFDHEVEVFELQETDFPCYVLARRVCKLVKSTDSDKFVRVSAVTGYINSTRGPSAHGPAALTESWTPGKRCFDIHERRSVDVVYSIRCLVWPPQATEWTTRRRYHNWPDTATINRVINNGCDIVHVAHPSCREDGVVNRQQWRLSFSRAETILLNTWSEIQQLVYHMLRVFVSTVQSGNRISVVKRYHIKTLLLWTVEHDLQLWNTCVINICTQLLHVLAEWLISAEFPMYFIPTCNLFDGIRCDAASGDLQYFVTELNNVTIDNLSDWFCANYIHRCVSQYPRIASSFDSSCPLQTVTSVASYYRQRDSIEISFNDFLEGGYYLQQLARVTSLNSQLNDMIIKQLQSIDARLIELYRALCLLRCVTMLERGHSIVMIANRVLSTTSPSHLSGVSCTNESVSSDCESSSVFSLLMKTARLSNHNKLLKDLLKIYLHTTLLEYSCNIGIHQLTNSQLYVYMACLYCSTGQYRTAVKHCVAVITTEPSSNNVSCIERQLLPQFDDNIERVLGLIALYQFVLNSSQKQLSQAEYSAAYSVDLLAHYLVVACLKREHYGSKCHSLRDSCVEYEKRVHDKGNKFIADILLCYFHQHQLASDKQTNKAQVYSLSDNCAAILAHRKPLGQFNTKRLAVLMIQSSVECLNSFRQRMSHDYNSVCDIVPCDYQAMYAYKCGLYDECFRLSQTNLPFLLYSDCSSVAHVLKAGGSDLLLLMDDDYSSLIGFTRVCGVINNEARGESVTQPTILAYILARSKLLLRHPITSLMDVLRSVQRVHSKCPRNAIIERALLTFVYRKIVLCLKTLKR